MTSATLQQPAPTRWAAWLTMARVSNTPTVASNVLAGAALAGSFEPQPAIGLLVIAMVVFYTAGMLLNDYCDYGWDRLHRPDRPLVMGAVSRQAALFATIALFALGTVLLWLVGPRAFASGVVLIGFIVLYDVWHKTNPLSPLVMAGCRLMVYVTAFVTFVWPPTLLLALGGAFLLLYLVGLTAIAKSEARPAVLDYWPAALLFLPGLYFSLLSPLLAIAQVAWVGFSIRLVYRRTERRIGTAIAYLIAGISLVDAVIMAAMGAPAVWIAIALVAFGLTLFLQRYVEGT